MAKDAPQPINHAVSSGSADVLFDQWIHMAALALGVMLKSPDQAVHMR